MLLLAKEIPDVDVMLSLEVEDLALIVLELMLKSTEYKSGVNCGNLCAEIWNTAGVPLYSATRRTEVQQAISEAFMWLESQVLLVPSDPGNPGNGWRRFGRRASRMKSTDDFSAFREGKALPRQLLHDSIAEHVRLLHMRGQYDTAVFEAMKQVEVAVRRASKLDALFGQKLVSSAFGPTGPLTDPGLPLSEQNATRALFEGAIGVYKNSQSHRHVGLGAKEAAQAILLASLLLFIVDDRDAGSPVSATPSA